MTELREIYQQVILDHNKNPRNYRKIENPTRHLEGYNHLCGDRLEVYLDVKDEVVTDIAFQGEGCAISKASASLMTESLKGRNVDEVEDIFRRFRGMVTDSIDAAVDSSLGKLTIFAGVRQYPMRIKCSTLAWVE